jgi:hypothetical protein
MPLTEVSANVRRNVSQSQKSILTSSHGQTPKKANADVVSSMLRTSTETGEIGQFSVRPSRIPRSASRMPMQNRSGSFPKPMTSRKPSARTPIPRYDSRRLPRPVPSISALSRHDTVRSSLTSYHSNPRSRCRGAHRHQYGSDRTVGPFPAAGLHSHRSLMTLRSRPGSRPTSPAFSDAHSMPMYYRPPGFHRAASIGTAASSPAPLLNRDFPYSYTDVNNSAPSLRRYPSPAMPGAFPGSRRSPFPSRNATPVSTAFLNPARRGNASVESFHTMQRAATASTAPLYYDYTEAFAEEYSTFLGREPISPLFGVDHAIPEQGPPPQPRQAQTPFGMVQGSIFQPSELPTPHNRRRSEHSKQSTRPEEGNSQHCEEISTEITEGNLGQPELSSRPSLGEFSRLSEASENVQVEPPARASEQDRQEDTQRRSSGFSRRDCPASPSTSFFPNASRNSRDLTSLAARVHSPTPADNSTDDIEASHRDEDDRNASNESSIALDHRPADWQLPSLTFRPLSFLQNRHESADRPRSSGGVAPSELPEIICPTPQRPMSSQSRRRFSKIFGVEEDASTKFHSFTNRSRSYSSLRFGQLRQVLETSEIIPPEKYSIPPFSPRNSTIAESQRDSESNVGNSDQEIGSRCEKSTVESLLDKHIECLGLRPEFDSESVASGSPEANSRRSPTVSSGKDESTVRIVVVPESRARPRARTLNSGNPSEIPVPKPLFQPDGARRPKLTGAHSTPCVSKMSLGQSSARPSLGWNTLPSTSNLYPDRSIIQQCASVGLGHTECKENSREESMPQDTKGPATRRASPSTSGRRSADSDELYNWDDNVPIRQSSRQNLLNRQISQRRKARMRLKLRRNSKSLGKISPSEPSSAQASFHTARAPSQDHVDIAEPSSKQVLAPGVDSEAVAGIGIPERGAQRSSTKQSSNPLPPAKPVKVPQRHSSVIATATQSVKHSIDIARKMSVRTIRSHHSKTSVVDPLNSTRLGAQAPHLASPDLGPPLTSTSLNMNFAFPQASVSTRPALRPTQSFFSDDSSAVQHARSSLRKKLNLPSLRSVLPSSPRTHSTATTPARKTETANSRTRLHQSCQMQGLKKEDEERDMYGTVGMSEFAYCRRRMLERVKGWWRRHALQGKLALRRRKAQPDSTHSHQLRPATLP